VASWLQSPPILDLPARYLDEVRTLLRRHVPGHEVWAYGSRVKGDAHPASDLDLVVRDPLDPHRPCPALPALRRALRDSDLPISVDVQDWALLPEAFRQEIERAYVVIQPQGPRSDPSPAAPAVPGRARGSYR
jgi:predicted nucleotidyltransferase